MVECKASMTVQPGMAGPLQSLRRSMGNHAPIRAAVIHQKSRTAPPIRAFAPQVEALDVGAFVTGLGGRTARRHESSRREA